jgi:hypothetical protein
MFATFPALVVTVAGQTGIVPHRRWMAGAAGRAAMIDPRATLVYPRFCMWEVKTGRGPGRGRMAIHATGTKCTHVEFRVRVTGYTLS